jgi:hypothetical protein
MNEFAAIVLICLNSVPTRACTSETAADVMSVHAESELECMRGWQEVVARSPFANQIGSTAYVKTLCERVSGKHKQRSAR